MDKFTQLTEHMFLFKMRNSAMHQQKGREEEPVPHFNTENYEPQK